MELIYIFRFSTPNEKEAMYVHPIAFDKLRVEIVITDKSSTQISP